MKRIYFILIFSLFSGYLLSQNYKISVGGTLNFSRKVDDDNLNNNLDIITESEGYYPELSFWFKDKIQFGIGYIHRRYNRLNTRWGINGQYWYMDEFNTYNGASAFFRCYFFSGRCRPYAGISASFQNQENKQVSKRPGDNPFSKKGNVYNFNVPLGFNFQITKRFGLYGQWDGIFLSRNFHKALLPKASVEYGFSGLDLDRFKCGIVFFIL